MAVSIVSLARRCARWFTRGPRPRIPVEGEREEPRVFVDLGGCPFHLEGQTLVSQYHNLPDGTEFTVHVERLDQPCPPRASESGEDARAMLVRLTRTIRIRLSVS